MEAYIARSQVRSVDEGPRPLADASRPVRGVSLMDGVQSRFGWSDRQLGRVLGVAGRPCPGAGGAVSLNSKRAVCAGGPGSRSTSRPRAGLDIRR